VLPELTTERLALRELTAEDAEALFAYRSHPNVARYQSWQPASIEDAHAFLASLKLHPPYTGGTWRQLGIELRADGSLIGDCGIHVLKTDSRHAEIGYTIAPDHQRNGYGTEAVRAVLGMLFGPLRMKRVAARTLAGNRASKALLERIGFRPEKNGRYVFEAEDWSG
jgi:RimJ/RimL family protein N-acetyltransferase